jgi:nitrite reductase (NO-forming)
VGAVGCIITNKEVFIMATSERRLFFTAIAITLVGVIVGTLLSRVLFPSTAGAETTERPGPAKEVDVAYISRSVTDLPPPLDRDHATTVDLYLEVQEVVAEIEDGSTFTYWTYNGQVPGPFFRVRVGDTVVVHFKNPAANTMFHSVDFHAVTGPGGGAVSTQTPPGGESTFQFKALHPGIFVYHCASPHIAQHISKGLYGLILVEPEEGLPPVDREFYVMQGEFYTVWPAGTKGHQKFAPHKMAPEEPTYVVFNGRFQGLTGDHALKAKVGETVRIYFGVGGTNLASSFHIIGEMFDRLYSQGDLISSPNRSIQTTLVPPGAAVAMEVKLEVPGDFILVDHALTRTLDKGALGILAVEGPENLDVYNENP